MKHADFSMLVGRAWTEPLLLLAGDVPVARLVLKETDFPWATFSFTPLPAWSSLSETRNAFDSQTRPSVIGGERLNRLRASLAARVRAIEDLDLWLATQHLDLACGDFQLLLREGAAHLRSHARGVLPELTPHQLQHDA